jgi:endoglucanase Acf2
MATYADLYVDRGTTFSRTIDLSDSSDSGVSLSGYTGSGQIRKTYSSSTKVDFTVTTNDNDLVIELSEAQTKGLKAGRYVYDIMIDNGTVRTKVLEGQLHVENSVTFDSP